MCCCCVFGFTGQGGDGPAVPLARLRGAQTPLHHAGEVLPEVRLCVMSLCVCLPVCERDFTAISGLKLVRSGRRPPWQDTHLRRLAHARRSEKCGTSSIARSLPPLCIQSPTTVRIYCILKSAALTSHPQPGTIFNGALFYFVYTICHIFCWKGMVSVKEPPMLVWCSFFFFSSLEWVGASVPRKDENR